MARTIILLLDSFGIGCAHDADAYGDKGADTLGHICDWLAKIRVTQAKRRSRCICRIWLSTDCRRLPS